MNKLKKDKQKRLDRESYLAGRILESDRNYKKWLYDLCKLDYTEEDL
tara:strand:- start:17656 stop:17796 length:141 start_codon:yes stop_codon:yes gene_type:complete